MLMILSLPSSIVMKRECSTKELPSRLKEFNLDVVCVFQQKLERDNASQHATTADQISLCSIFLLS